MLPGIVPLLRGADLGTRARALWQVQRQAGNRAAQPVLQRQALTDAQQWAQDWAAHPAQQHHFRGTGRPSGTPRQRYDVLAPLYEAHGIPRPMVYLATSITAARFFGFSTPAHVDLAAALRTAEATLRAGGVTTAPVTKVWALNPRTTSAGGWSNHTDGRAVDIDPGTNPHLTSRAQRHVIGLVTGTDMEAGGQGCVAMKNSSDTCGAAAERRLRAGQQRQVKRRKAELARKTRVLEKKRTARDRYPLRTYGAQGFLNLPEELVDALTGAGLRWGGNWSGAKDFMHFNL